MRKVWGGAIVAAGIVAALVLMRDAEGEAEPPKEAAPVVPAAPSARGAASSSGSSARSGALEAAPAAPAAADAPAPNSAPTTADPKKPHTSLVEKAWNERASQQAFDGEDGAAPEKYPLTKDGIQAAVRAKKEELKSCYESWQKMQPDLGGRIVTRFEITKDEENEDVARIQEVSLPESELDNVFMEGCVRQVMEELRFDPPESGKLTVNYPLTFSSGDDAAKPAEAR